MKIAVIGLVVVATMLGACRREEAAYEPMKLGAGQIDRDAR